MSSPVNAQSIEQSAPEIKRRGVQSETKRELEQPDVPEPSTFAQTVTKYSGYTLTLAMLILWLVLVLKHVSIIRSAYSNNGFTFDALSKMGGAESGWLSIVMFVLYVSLFVFLASAYLGNGLKYW